MDASDAASGEPDQFVIREPLTAQEWENYFDLRWRVLRQPWGQPRGSERDDLDGKSFHLLVGDPTGTIVGVGRLHVNSPSEAQVRYMAVDDAWRGRGLGSRILRGLEDRALSQGVTNIVLNARAPVLNFYRRHGYVAEGPAETLFGTVRHFRMRKELRRR